MLPTDDSTTKPSNYYAFDNASIVKDIAQEIKRLRIKKNISQHQMAEKTGLDRVTISRFENGRAATLLTFVQILRSLDHLEFLEMFKHTFEKNTAFMEPIAPRARKRASKPRSRPQQDSVAGTTL